MSETLNHDGTGERNTEHLKTKKLVLPEGYEIVSEVDIEEIQSALEAYADNVSLAG